MKNLNLRKGQLKMSRQIKVWYYVKLLIFLKASIKSKFETILNYHFFFLKKKRFQILEK